MSDATWHPKRVTHGKSHMVHLNVWLTIIHMIDDAIKGNKGIKKKEKKMITRKKKDKKQKIQKEKSKNRERESVRGRYICFYFFLFDFL